MRELVARLREEIEVERRRVNEVAIEKEQECEELRKEIEELKN